MPNDIENMNNDIVNENNARSNFKNPTPNSNQPVNYSYAPNANFDLAVRNNFAQQNAVSNQPNIIDDRSNANQNNVNVNDNNSNNASNGEDITNVSINTLDESVSETLVRLCFLLLYRIKKTLLN